MINEKIKCLKRRQSNKTHMQRLALKTSYHSCHMHLLCHNMDLGVPISPFACCQHRGEKGRRAKPKNAQYGTMEVFQNGRYLFAKKSQGLVDQVSFGFV